MDVYSSGGKSLSAADRDKLQTFANKTDCGGGDFWPRRIKEALNHALSSDDGAIATDLLETLYNNSLFGHQVWPIIATLLLRQPDIRASESKVSGIVQSLGIENLDSRHYVGEANQAMTRFLEGVGEIHEPWAPKLFGVMLEKYMGHEGELPWSYYGDFATPRCTFSPLPYTKSNEEYKKQAPIESVHYLAKLIAPMMDTGHFPIDEKTGHVDKDAVNRHLDLRLTIQHYAQLFHKEFGVRINNDEFLKKAEIPPAIIDIIQTAIAPNPQLYHADQIKNAGKVTPPGEAVQTTV